MMPDDLVVPDGWCVEPLSGCADVLDSRRKPINSKERASRAGPIPYYGATGQVGWIDDYLFDEELVLLGEDGAPFLDKSKSIAYIIDGKSWVNNHAHVLRARSDVTTNRYIKHYLDSFDFNGYVEGSTRDKLTQGAMNSIPVLLPPRPIQDALVNLVDTAGQKRVSAAAHLSAARRAIERFHQAVLAAACSGRLSADMEDQSEAVQELLPRIDDLRAVTQGKKYRLAHQPPDHLPDLPSRWTWVCLERVIATGPQNGLYLPQSKYGSGVPILRIEDFQLDSSRSSNQLRRVDASKADVLRYSLQDGDVVVNRVNSPSHLGKSLAVQPRHLPALFESNMMRIQLLAEAVLPQWVDLFLRSVRGRQLLTRNAKWAVNQASINQGDVVATPIPLPPLPEQREIVRRVDGLLLLAARLHTRVEATKGHVGRSSQALLAKAFRGELVGTRK
jgi:type I restriction enzyme S subunit